jgi:N-acetylmuramoyl-L-alanine amidase-like protein
MRYPGAEWRPISINYRSGGNIPTLFIVHIMQGTLAGSDSWFRNPRAQVSAHFGVSKAGTIYQWVDTHDTAWHAMSANHRSIGVEHEGDTGEHLTAAQLEADAKLFAWSTEHHAIPASLARGPEGSGLAYHALGSSSWGGHLQCPGQPIIGQLPAMLKRAKQICAGGGTPPAPSVRKWESAGQLTLHDLAADHLHEQVSTVLRVTAEHGGFSSALTKHINAVFAGDARPCPAGVTWHYPGGDWTTKGQLSLSALAAAELKTTPAAVLALTASHSPDAKFLPNAAEYVNAVFQRTSIKVPKGAVLCY